jgi:hypothetical protein
MRFHDAASDGHKRFVLCLMLAMFAVPAIGLLVSLLNR